MTQGTRIIVALLVILLIVTGLYWITTGSSRTSPEQAAGRAGEGDSSAAGRGEQPMPAPVGGSRSALGGPSPSREHAAGARAGARTDATSASERRPGAPASEGSSSVAPGSTPRVEPVGDGLSALGGERAGTAAVDRSPPDAGALSARDRFSADVSGKGDMPELPNFSRRPTGPLPPLAHMPAGLVPADRRAASGGADSAPAGRASAPGAETAQGPTGQPPRAGAGSGSVPASRSDPAARRSAESPRAGSDGAAARSSPAVLVEEYVIQEGDTLTVIADMWFGDGRRWPAVLAANEGIDPVRLRVGQTIKLPPRDATAGAAATGPRPAPAAAPTAGRTVDAAGYLVQEGDTLYSIARARLGDGTRWEEIYDANRAVIGEDPRRLKVGTRLSLPN